MLSYLHGIRPYNRRSAIPPVNTSHNASFSRSYHDVPSSSNQFDFHPPPSGYPQRTGIASASPVSPAPPTLPPIPRVISQDDPLLQEHEGYIKGQASLPTPTAGENGFPEGGYVASASNQLNLEDAPMASMSPDREAGMKPQTLSTSIPAEQAQPGPARRKGPIDIRCKPRRAYSEYPLKQSSYATQHNVNGVLQPCRSPPVPFKTFQAPPPLSPNVSQVRPQLEPGSPAIRPPGSTYDSGNEKPLEYSQHQAYIQALPSQSDPTHQTTSVSHHRHSKAKLNLLNPMALLARKRSHQLAGAASAEGQAPLALHLPDDYDPRIRGNVVHDFSAPRPAKTAISKSNDALAQESAMQKSSYCAAARRGERPASTERDHAPVFKEHFDDGLEKSQDPANRSSSYLHQLSSQASQPQPDPSHLPAFARKLPSNISTNADSLRKTPRSPLSVPLEAVPESPNRYQTPALSTSPMSPPRISPIAPCIYEHAAPGQESPKRYQSNASRFSFDLAGVGSAAQEKMLEDKHRQKANRKQRNSSTTNEAIDDQYNAMDYDDMDSYEYEERIPGVNCDEDEDTFGVKNMPVLQRDMQSFDFASPNKSSFESTISPVSTGVTSPDTPRDKSVLPVGTRSFNPSPKLGQAQSEELLEGSEAGKGSRPQPIPGDSSRTISQSRPLEPDVAPEEILGGLPQRQTYLDDDIYFDDGMIDDVGSVSDHEFDEGVFDDNSNGIYGLPLRDRTLRPLPGPDSEFGRDHESRPGEESFPRCIDHGHQGGNALSPHRSLSSAGVTVESLRERDQQDQLVSGQTIGLTQDNLAAYNHNALSMAVKQAAKNGAFDRSLSFESPQEAGQADLTQNMSDATSQMAPGLPESGHFDEYGDEGPDDDPIVAAANAEALENDDEGFYGREFGFFAKSYGSSEAEYSNGGYFGPRSLQAMHRSYSGKATFQEPSLTPITERSELSKRNSTVSLAMYGHPLSATSATSPQFPDMPLDDLNIQLAMLKQLRRGAWGGSDVSLPSTSNSQNSGSPLTHPPANMLFHTPLHASNSNVNLQTMASSFHSFSSSSPNESNPSPSADSPTITLPSTHALPTQKTPPVVASPTQSMNVLRPSITPHPAPPSPAPVRELSPSTRNRKTQSHSRTYSGAESVSYKEEGGRWVIETRRMSETGEEILGRSMVVSGRI
ncbi:MAG: hypothetical protein Q9163_003076 [Psora crenata]